MIAEKQKHSVLQQFGVAVYEATSVMIHYRGHVEVVVSEESGIVVDEIVLFLFLHLQHHRLDLLKLNVQQVSATVALVRGRPTAAAHSAGHRVERIQRTVKISVVKVGVLGLKSFACFKKGKHLILFLFEV